MARFLIFKQGCSNENLEVAFTRNSVADNNVNTGDIVVDMNTDKAYKVVDKVYYLYERPNGDEYFLEFIVLPVILQCRGKRE